MSCRGVSGGFQHVEEGQPGRAQGRPVEGAGWSVLVPPGEGDDGAAVPLVFEGSGPGFPRLDHQWVSVTGILLAVGNSLGDDDQLRLAMTLLHLPAAVARRPAGYPAEALDIQVLIQPAASIDETA